MAVKSIIDIDVNDSSFQKFQELFLRYQEQVKAAPAAWKKVGEAVDGTAVSMEGIVAALSAQTSMTNQLTRQRNEEQKADREKVARAREAASETARATSAAKAATEAQAKLWKDMARTSKTFAGNITEATRSLLRWASLTGVISGLLGVGGLFGIERLATSAGSARRSGLGLGITPGEQSAFETNYGRVIDPSHFLSGVNEALHDVTKQQSLTGAGLTNFQGRGTADVAADLIPALKKIADQTPEAMMAQVLKARGLDQFITLQDFQRLKNTPSGELAEYAKSFQQDRVGLDLTKDQQKAWQDLQVQLDRAGKSIERTFITALTPLAPEIKELSESFTQMVKDILGSDGAKAGIHELAVGLHTFGEYVKSPEFRESVKNFVTDVEALAEGVGHAIKWLRSWFKDSGDYDKTGPGGAPGTKEPAEETGPGGGYIPKPGEKPWWRGNDNKTPNFNVPSFNGPPNTTPAPTVPGLVPMAFRPGNDNFTSGISTSLIDSVEYQESRGHDVTNASSGAAGYLQFMPATAKQYGVDVHNEASSRRGAERYLTDLRKQFGGSTEKALAAYNWGPGNLQKDIRQYGDAWKEHLPAETKKYISDILGRVGGNRGNNVTIDIRNNTGGNAVVNASQLAI